MYSVKVLKDSLAPCGKRLTTFELVYPRFVHAELLTHRTFSRNSASSRAIPTHTMLKNIKVDPALPVWWGKNQKGMSAPEELEPEKQREAMTLWTTARDAAVYYAESLHDLGVHKQIANRVLEPWMFITTILSGTEFDNFFKLRCHPDAQPELRFLADHMLEHYQQSEPEEKTAGTWHLPLVYPEDHFLAQDDIGYLKKVSVGRCARVSYLTHDGKRDLDADVALCDRLKHDQHWSPFEHVSMALAYPFQSGNYIGWRQYREYEDPPPYGSDTERSE